MTGGYSSLGHQVAWTAWYNYMSDPTQTPTDEPQFVDKHCVEYFAEGINQAIREARREALEEARGAIEKRLSYHLFDGPEEAQLEREQNIRNGAFLGALRIIDELIEKEEE